MAAAALPRWWLHKPRCGAAKCAWGKCPRRRHAPAPHTARPRCAIGQASPAARCPGEAPGHTFLRPACSQTRCPPPRGSWRCPPAACAPRRQTRPTRRLAARRRRPTQGSAQTYTAARRAGGGAGRGGRGRCACGVGRLGRGGGAGHALVSAQLGRMRPWCATSWGCCCAPRRRRACAPCMACAARRRLRGARTRRTRATRHAGQLPTTHPSVRSSRPSTVVTAAAAAAPPPGGTPPPPPPPPAPAPSRPQWVRTQRSKGSKKASHNDQISSCTGASVPSPASPSSPPPPPTVPCCLVPLPATAAAAAPGPMSARHSSAAAGAPVSPPAPSPSGRSSRERSQLRTMGRQPVVSSGTYTMPHLRPEAGARIGGWLAPGRKLAGKSGKRLGRAARHPCRVLAA